MAIPVHRYTDSRSCGASTVVTNQSTVYANNLLISVQGDGNTHGGGSLHASVNPGTVYIENLEMVVVGSTASPDRLCSSKRRIHCNPISTSGSDNVYGF